MTTLAVTRSLVSSTNPTEAQFDIMRTFLLNYFNTTSLDEGNLLPGGMLYSSLSALGDDESLTWTSSHATILYDSGNDTMENSNTQGSIIFGLRSGSTLTNKMKLSSTDGSLALQGNLDYNTATGDHTVDLMWLLANYRKPLLGYVSNDIVEVLDNGVTAGAVLVVMRDRLCTIIDTTCSLAVDANGETTGDIGAAVSGLGAGLTRTANRWYYIYAVRVQYGSDANGRNAILVATGTSPETGNITTLDTAYGAGEWVYMGVIRNGYNDGVSTNIIVPFVYDESGYLRFTKGTASEGAGVTVASASSSTSDLSYTLVIGNAAAATVPIVATRIIFSGYRSQYGAELHYRSVSTSENQTIVTGCYHPIDASTLVVLVRMEVPVIDGYKVVVVTGSSSTNQRITILGFLDRYI